MMPMLGAAKRNMPMKYHSKRHFKAGNSETSNPSVDESSNEKL